MRIVPIFLFFLLFIDLASAYSIGIVPKEIVFDQNNVSQVVLYNPNPVEASYSLEIEDHASLFLFDSNGSIAAHGFKRILIGINGSKNMETRLNAQLMFDGNGIGLSPEASVKVIVMNDEIGLWERMDEIGSVSKGLVVENVSKIILIVIIGMIFVFLMVRG